MEKEIKQMEMVTILFIDGIITYHERDELLMRLQHKLDLKQGIIENLKNEN